MKGLGGSEKMQIKKMLFAGKMIFLDPTILEVLRLVAPLYHKKQILDANDMIIAATALAKNIPLATLNRKHFSFIKGLKLVHLG